MKKSTFQKGILSLMLFSILFTGKLSAQTASLSPTNPTVGVGVSASFTATASGFCGFQRNYDWTATGASPASVSTGNTGSNTNSQSFTWAAPGTYTLSVNIFRTGGCGTQSATASTTVTVITVNAGPDQLVAGTSVTLVGSTSAGSPTYAWTKTSGPAGQTITSPSSAVTSVTGLVPGTYVFRLTVNGSVFDEVTVRVITGTNLWASSSSGTQISSYSVSGGSYISGPTTMFAPSYPGAANTYTRTAALGRNDKTTQTSGYFYWLGTSDGSNQNNGLVEVFGASAAGNSPSFIGSIDLNGGSGNELGFVRLGMGPDGTGWILAGDGTTLYLAKFTSNGLNPASVTIEDVSVSLTGGIVADFINGDICMDATGKLFALANDGSGVTQIFIGSPAGASTTLTKKWDLVDPSNAPFTGSVNGVAFDILGALYISTSGGLYYINPATVNGPAGTVQCALVQSQSGLQDLASNVFPSTILLPVKLGDFTVVRQGANAVLNWQTLSEINADHFEIERSYDGINFTAVGTKQAAGNSADVINYQFTDPIVISSGNIYYRLKTTDIDAKSSYSKIVVLRLGGGIVKDFTVYPNPFTSDLKIQISSVKESVATIRIHNAAGQLLISRNITIQKGENIIVLSSELQTLKPGMHLMEIITEDGKVSQKIIKR